MKTSNWMFLALLVLAAPAHAQDLGVADKLATGTVEYVLAFGIVILMAVCGFLGKALLDSFNARLEAQDVAHERSLQIVARVATLAEKQNESMDVVDKALDRLLPKRD